MEPLPVRPRGVSCTPGLKFGQNLRRYMDLAKYLDLLRTEELFLNRADRIPDRFEGAPPRLMAQYLDSQHKLDATSQDARAYQLAITQRCHLSCWSIGLRDNMALWQLYGGPDKSVAITTSVKRLIDAGLAWDRSVAIRRVNYVDHNKLGTFVIAEPADLLELAKRVWRPDSLTELVVGKR